MSPEGSKSNKTGNLLEHTLKSVLRDKGFQIVTYKDWVKHPENYGKELLLTNIPFQTIYDHKGKTEYLLKSAKNNIHARIECKWQQSAGSVDEKLPYLYLNAIEVMPEDHVIIIIDGAGWKKGSITWLKNAIKENKYRTEKNQHKKIEVFSLAEFMAWANNTF